MNELSSLTFDQLKQKLKEVYNDPVQSNIVRLHMKNKYTYYLKKRNMMKNKITKKSELDECGFTDSDFNFDDNNKDDAENIDALFSDEDFKTAPTHGDLDELKDPKFDEKFETEVERDHLNNYLMSRMDSEMHMRKNQKIRKNNKDFLAPFASGSTAGYSSAYGDDGTIQDFTSGRFVRDKQKVEPYFIKK